jgi:hypothetical protein
VGPRAVLSALASVYKFLLAIVVQFLRNAFCRVTREKWSLLSDSGQVEVSATVGCDNNVSGNHIHIWLRLQHPWSSGGIHPHAGGPRN